jgi:secretion/DNA translocation related TadE-like protein
MALALVQVAVLLKDQLVVVESARAGAREAAVTQDDAATRRAATEAASSLDATRLDVTVERQGGAGTPVSVGVTYHAPIAIPVLAVPLHRGPFGHRHHASGDRVRRAERGSVTVLVAGVLLLVGVLTLASVDLLRALEAKARAQTAADAAALAAAQEIAAPSGIDPTRVAEEFAARNGAALLECRCSSGGSDAIVRVEVPVSMVFVGPDRTVTRTARAVIEGR